MSIACDLLIEILVGHSIVYVIEWHHCMSDINRLLTDSCETGLLVKPIVVILTVQIVQ